MNWYLIENYRTNQTGLNNFYISWTNIKGGNQDKIQDESGSVTTVYDWVVEFYCRYKVNGNWEYYKIIYNVYSSVDPFVKLNFSNINFNYIVQKKKLSDVYYTIGNSENDDYTRDYIGSILTDVLSYYNNTGIKNANKQAANVYEYFAATLFTDGYNVRIVNASRGNFKQDNKIDNDQFQLVKIAQPQQNHLLHVLCNRLKEFLKSIKSFQKLTALKKCISTVVNVARQLSIHSVSLI